MLYLIFFLSCFIGKGGVTFDLDWDRRFNNREMEELALEAFFESYRQSHTFDHLSDIQLQKEIVRFWKNKKDHIKADYVICARREEKLAGLAVFEKRDGDTVYLAELMTSPDFWGHGLGTTLIHSIHEKDPQVKKILLICEKANTKTVQFYQSHGFNPIKEDALYITFLKMI